MKISTEHCEVNAELYQALNTLELPVAKYSDVADAILFIASAREYQAKAWPQTTGPDAGSRPSEEWLCLLQHYQNKMMAVYAESNGETPEGRQRMAKYAAIVANLALWLVQATAGPVLGDIADAEQKLRQQNETVAANIQSLSGAVLVTPYLEVPTYA